ncbi:hypothetical protein CASFOL_001768 [Castilleja foliolosa]|uniref:Uncharacterized protein n=1 Tax=Castilleja foliolosa TaxID=1961234 RepID=A0ABD3EEB5_9LAMI
MARRAGDGGRSGLVSITALEAAASPSPQQTQAKRVDSWSQVTGRESATTVGRYGGARHYCFDLTVYEAMNLSRTLFPLRKLRTVALTHIRDGRGRFSRPLLVSWVGLLSTVISTHKN